MTTHDYLDEVYAHLGALRTALSDTPEPMSLWMRAKHVQVAARCLTQHLKQTAREQRRRERQGSREPRR
jgi:hypothetical protein